MAFSIQYKKLFEVEILHEYFLEKEGGARFFDLKRDSKERFDRLRNYDIRDYLVLEPTGKCEKQLRDFRMIFKTTRKGFFVGVEVDEFQSNEGLKQYKPTIEFASNLSLDFRQIVVDEQFTRLSNKTLHGNLKAKYLFSIPENSVNRENTEQPLLLATPTGAYTEEKQYEAGDRVSITEDNNMVVYQAKFRTKSRPAQDSDGWKPIDKDYGYISGEDMKLIPRYVSYRFNSKKPILRASFRLVNKEGEEVWSQLFDNPERGRTQFALHLSERVLQEALIVEKVKPGPYILEVEGRTSEANGQFIDKRQVLLSDNLYRGGENRIHQKAFRASGLVKVDLNPDNQAYRVLDDNGFLRNNAGKLQTPVFEIRFQSLESEWIYSGPKIDSLAIDEAKSSVFRSTVKERNVLKTKDMLPLIQSGTKVKLVLENQEAYYLPNPNGFNITFDTEGRKFLEVFVNGI